VNKSIVPRELARSDVEAAVDYYAREAGSEVALGFIDALEDAYDLIASHPEAWIIAVCIRVGVA
jgi:toxin ParE1/3/4